ncbi:MAG: YjjG family noncanonical pyrimidine nucleotidase [Paludibacteraceae bacterium]|nr:YjjG family noncanonical pyrimidine nucleotidase [Paludibacteraceae bacterium]
MKYKHLFFDLDNTLWDFDKNSQVSLHELFDAYQLIHYYPRFEDFFEIFKKQNEVLWEMYGKGQIDKNFLHYERFRFPFENTPFEAQLRYKELADEYLLVVKTKTHLKPFAKEILEYLKDKNYMMYIVSNGFTEVQYHKLENAGIGTYFQRIFLSESIKEHKPSKAFFDYAITSSNARKTESLVIGDNWEADIVGAKNAGIDQVFYNYTNRIDLPFAPTFQVSCLSDLKNFI